MTLADARHSGWDMAPQRLEIELQRRDSQDQIATITFASPAAMTRISLVPVPEYCPDQPARPLGRRLTGLILHYLPPDPDHV